MNVASSAMCSHPFAVARMQKSFSSPYPRPKLAASKGPTSSSTARRMSMQTPTAVGRRTYIRFETRSTSLANEMASNPVGSRFSSNARGTETSVA
jgi:hypothetical protein